MTFRACNRDVHQLVLFHARMQVHPHMPMLASGGTAPIVRVWAPCGDPASSREVEETQRADNKDAHLEWHATHGPHLSSSQRALAMANVHDIEAQAGGRRAGDAGPASPAHWAGSAVAARLFSELVGCMQVLPLYLIVQLGFAVCLAVRVAGALCAVLEFVAQPGRHQIANYSSMRL